MIKEYSETDIVAAVEAQSGGFIFFKSIGSYPNSSPKVTTEVNQALGLKKKEDWSLVLSNCRSDSSFVMNCKFYTRVTYTTLEEYK